MTPENRFIQNQDLYKASYFTGSIKTLEDYDKELKINPSNVRSLINKSIILYNFGRYEDALKACDKAIEINLHDSTPRIDKGFAWINKGMILNFLGRYEDALKACDEAIEINPHDSAALFNQGVVLCNLGRYADASKAYDKYLEIVPDYPYALNNKGVALCNLGRDEDAIKTFDKALKIYPKFDLAYKNKGELLAKILQRANIACKQSKGTPAEELACKINQEVQKWQISDQEQMTQNVDNLIFTLKAKIPPHPTNKEIYENIDKIGKEKDLIKQYQLIVILIALIPQTVIGGIMTNEYIGGDKIVANHSSIVSKSSFSNAINNIKESGNDEIAKAIEDLARLIEKANFEKREETIENVESLAEEAAKQNPRKGTMRVLGESIINSVQKISDIVEKVSPLIKIISKLWLY